MLNLISLFTSFKVIRIGIAISILVGAFFTAKTAITSLMSQVSAIMPGQFIQIWNYFQMTDNVAIIIGAYITVLIYSYVVKFAEIIK